MRFSIVIPTYNHLDDFLKPCIESILKYTDLSDGEVVIVANGCTDGTREYVESLGAPFKLVWREEGLGYTKATNLGVAESSGEFVILMNNDFLLLPQEKNQWLNYLINPIKDKIGMTCNLKIWDESVERMFAVFFCACTTRKLWDKIGGLDESWSPGGGEDIEFCIKLEQLGYEIIQVPDEYNEVKDGINVNRFPSYHAGEGTMMDAEHREMWEKHIQEVRARLRHKYRLPDGWFYGGDIDEYRRLVEDVPDGGAICELGCFYGRSLCSVADIIKRKNLEVYVVDTFEGTESERSEKMDFASDFNRNCERFGISPNIYVGRTDDMVRFVPDKSLDLLFIDADHSYESVKRDIENWLPKLKEHGTISGHDYGNHPGVARAVNERWYNVRVYSHKFAIHSGVAVGSIWSKRL